MIPDTDLLRLTHPCQKMITFRDYCVSCNFLPQFFEFLEILSIYMFACIKFFAFFAFFMIFQHYLGVLRIMHNVGFWTFSFQFFLHIFVTFLFIQYFCICSILSKCDLFCIFFRVFSLILLFLHFTPFSGLLVFYKCCVFERFFDTSIFTQILDTFFSFFYLYLMFCLC